MLAIAPTFDGRRTVPSPEVTKLMLEMLALKPGEKVLEIGTGSGYQTQALAETGAEVHSVELEPWVDTTQILGDCVYLHSGDGKLGLPQFAPFDAIVATCGVSEIPTEWCAQLSEGGKLLVPIGESASQRLTVFRKHNSELRPERVCAYTRFQMMREKPQPRPPKYQPDGQS